MTDATAEFFEDLSRRPREPLLQKATGTVRFDLESGRKTESWSVTIDKGDLTVSREAGAAAQCTFRASKALFDGVASGRVNAIAALLRGSLAIEGDWRLAVLVQRLFPGPPGGRARPSRAKRTRGVAGSKR